MDERKQILGYTSIPTAQISAGDLLAFSILGILMIAAWVCIVDVLITGGGQARGHILNLHVVPLGVVALGLSFGGIGFDFLLLAQPGPGLRWRRVFTVVNVLTFAVALVVLCVVSRA
jgi:hypothetical protein